MIGLSTYLADLCSRKIQVPIDTYFGLLYLLLVFWLLRFYVSRSAISNPNQWVRRTMSSSMLRLVAVSIFMIITFVNRGKADLLFAIPYCLYFLLFLVFEMSKKSSNLRPD
ncbi:MAG: hypothetical protein O3B82_03130 [Bacteroidetes bacterium]|nr:hypothetical protein [Bacteroidota bacterium]